ERLNYLLQRPNQSLDTGALLSLGRYILRRTVERYVLRRTVERYVLRRTAPSYRHTATIGRTQDPRHAITVDRLVRFSVAVVIRWHRFVLRRPSPSHRHTATIG